MEGAHNLEQHIQTPEIQKEKPQSDVLRGGRRWFNRLVGGAVLGAAALAPQGEANAGQYSVGKAVVINAIGAPLGVSAQRAWNGEMVVNVDPAQAARMAEMRRQQEIQRQQQIAQQQQQMMQRQQQAAFEQFLQQPTKVGWDNMAKDFFNKNGLTMADATRTFYIYHPDNIKGRFFLNGDNVKYASINFRQAAPNAFFIDLQYVGVSTRQKGAASILVEYDPVKKVFAQLK